MRDRIRKIHPSTTLFRQITAFGCLVMCIGCQQTQNRTPWNQSAAAQPPSQVNIPNPLAGVGDPGATVANSDAFTRELLARQAEQARLSDLQRQELARLTDLYRAQSEKLADVGREKFRDDRMELAKKIEDQTLQLRQKEEELQRMESLRRRSLELDSDNRDLHKQLAQSQQQVRLYEDQLKVMRQQLGETANRLAETIELQQQSDQQVAAMQANLQRQSTLQRRSGATITANSSTQPIVSAIQIAGLNIRQDGDVVRIELPSDQLFLPGVAQINPQSHGLLSQVAIAIGQHYPRQKIGIEAHTDDAPLRGTRWRNNHQLSAAQAMAVFEQLAETERFNPRQMFVCGHGPNYPVASNSTPEGQQRNRRVEVVVYPEVID